MSDFDIGTKVVCIKEISDTLDTKNFQVGASFCYGVNGSYLKLGKLFTICDKTIVISSIIELDYLYKLVSDSGELVNWIDSSYFNTLSEIRNDKLEKLGIKFEN